MLQDLCEIEKPLVEKIARFNVLNCELPDMFTSEVKQIFSDTVEFGKYCSCITSSSGLRIFISNNWFYIAAILAPLHKPLYEFKRIVNEIVPAEILKTKNSEEIIKHIQSSTYSQEDKALLIKFATDYNWWNGGNGNSGKSLDRGDCMVSAIIAMARVLNNSQSYICTLWDFLGNNSQYIQLLNDYVDKYILDGDPFKTFNNATVANNKNTKCLQQIYYGAPGTGKSHTINEKTEGESVIRTTFHPDSDYSTFVGAYKPTMGLLPICDELGQAMKIGSTILHKEQIIYEFVDQAFLQAYVKAWKNLVLNEGKKQYLVIEEINRGNCAQIFGDLFQLLDRNEYGFSDYPIQADKDMRKFLKKAFARQDEPDKQIFLQDEDKKRINQQYKSGDDVVSKVFSGEILLLPNNLYIWATMNTSDQSLFPIDSAFKRRWDWQYMPIGKGFDANGGEIKWAIEGATKKYDWWSFLEKINEQVGEATQSEDKKLGFFFCKASEGIISAEKFVGKVIFYLWNDVFKNNGFEGPIFKDADGTELSFGKFYKSDASGNAIVQKDKVELFLTNLGVQVAGTNNPIDDPLPEVDEDGNNASSATKDFSKYAINGNGAYSKGSVVLEAMKLYIANNPNKDAISIVNDWLALGVNVPNFVETEAMFIERKQKFKDSRINEKAKTTTLSNGETLYVSNQYNPERMSDVISKVNAANWNITISKI